MKKELSISFFGGVNIDNEKDFKETFFIGEIIGKNGYTLKHGGYGGYMEEVARGCKSVGGKCIALDLANMNWGFHNKYVDEVIVCDNISSRLKKYGDCEAIIVYNGGVGTLYEALHFIHHFINYPDDRKPIIFMGSRVIKLFNYLKDNLWITHSPDRDISYIKYIYNINEFNKFINELGKN